MGPRQLVTELPIYRLVAQNSVITSASAVTDFVLGKQHRQEMCVTFREATRECAILEYAHLSQRPAQPRQQLQWFSHLVMDRQLMVTYAAHSLAARLGFVTQDSVMASRF